MKLFEFHSISLEQKSNQRKSYDEIREIQCRKIQRIVKHAFETVPYYNDLFKKNGIDPERIKSSDDLQIIPVSTKDDIINAGCRVISTMYRNSPLDIRRTGGSTGKTLSFYQSYRDGVYAAVSYDRARMENGFDPSSDTIVFIGPFKDEIIRQATLKARIDFALKLRKQPVFIDMADNQQNIERLLMRNRYNSIKSYPSFFYALAHRIRSGMLKMPRIKHMFTASEVLDERTRDYINNTFNVDVKDIYGCWEGGCIGWECEKHEGYHTNIDFVALQVLEDDTVSREHGKGNLILTNLNSYAVPFIRYQINDIVEVTSEHCSCGRPFPLIKSIAGRIDDFIKLTNGAKISPPGLLVVMHEFSENVLEFQIIQEKYDELNVRVVLAKSEDALRIKNDILSGLQRHINDKKMKISINAVSFIEKTRSGKHKSIISKIL